MEGILDFQEFESANISCTLYQTHWTNARRNAKCTFKKLNWGRNARRKDEKSTKYRYNVTYFIVWLALGRWTKSRAVIGYPSGEDGTILPPWDTDFFLQEGHRSIFFFGVFSHIINPLLTKRLRSRWLDISLVHFLRVWGPRLHFGP